MYKIGDFAKITNLSVKTLRYYNELGLLIPEKVDVYTGYRFYGKNNLKDAKTIAELKKAGFRLEEIRDNWDSFNEELFLNKKKELYNKLENVELQIKQVDYLRSKLNHNIKKLEMIDEEEYK